MEYNAIFPVATQPKDTLSALQAKLGDYNFKKFSVDVPGESYAMDHYQVSKKNGDSSYYYPEKTPKEKIVLHFTAGKLPGDIKSLSMPNNKVSTAFIVGRDGIIYKMFASSSQWSYHLGRGAVGGNTHQSKLSVGIEISNWGPLIKDGDVLRPWGYTNVSYAKVSQKDAYIELDEEFRGTKYYANYTDKQYNGLVLLLKYLTAAYKIPRTFVDASTRYVPFADTATARNFKGICSHVNYRGLNKIGKYDKWDLGPAFDWDKVITRLNDPNFRPVATRGGTPGEKASAAQIEAFANDLHKDFGNTDPSAYGEDGPEI